LRIFSTHFPLLPHFYSYPAIFPNLVSPRFRLAILAFFRLLPGAPNPFKEQANVKNSMQSVLSIRQDKVLKFYDTARYGVFGDKFVGKAFIAVQKHVESLCTGERCFGKNPINSEG